MFINGIIVELCVGSHEFGYSWVWFHGVPICKYKITIYANTKVKEGSVRVWAYVCPHIKDVFVMCRVIEREVNKCIIPGGTKKLIFLSELCQDFTEFFIIYETEMPCVNLVKDDQRKGIW